MRPSLDKRGKNKIVDKKCKKKSALFSKCYSYTQIVSSTKLMDTFGKDKLAEIE